MRPLVGRRARRKAERLRNSLDAVVLPEYSGVHLVRDDATVTLCGLNIKRTTTHSERHHDACRRCRSVRRDQGRGPMSDLRAPDPTLDALSDDSDLMIEHYGEAGVAIAHRVVFDEWRIACGKSEEEATHWSVPDYARWFAVPCRECFPSAPIPGAVWTDGCTCYGGTHEGVHERGCGMEQDPHLAWQVPS